jgi:hypothetical protein
VEEQEKSLHPGYWHSLSLEQEYPKAAAGEIRIAAASKKSCWRQRRA